MSEVSKRIEEKIINGEVNYNVKAPNQKKESVFKKIILWPFKTLLEMFALDTAWSNGASRVLNSTRPHHMYTPQHQESNPSSFRERHHFNHEEWIIKERQARAYHQMVDGKGDPEPHNCHHERDGH